MQSFTNDRTEDDAPETLACPPPSEPLLMPIPEAAAALGLSPRRLYDLAARRALPEGIVIRLGRTVRISRPRLMAWLATLQQEDTDAQS